jgi:protein SCO1
VIAPLFLIVASQLPPIEFEQRLDAAVPLDVELTAEDGARTTLEEQLSGRPAILALVYFECPMLCTLVMNGIVGALRAVALEPGRDFDVIAVSIDPRETPALARKAKTSLLKRYAKPNTEGGWHLLVGEKEQIDRIAKAIGFAYQWDERTQQYAHAAGFVVLTPEGRTAHYFYGVEYSPRDLRLALVEASQGRIGGLVDRVLLYCYHYDPEKGRYGLAIMRVIRIAGGLTVLALLLSIRRAIRKERR